MTPALTLPSTRFWREYPREGLVLAVLGVAAVAALGGAAYSTPSLSGLTGGDTAAPENALPAPPPLLVRKLAPQDALSVNQTIPLSASPNPSAQPFVMRSTDEATRARALECLTSAVYYEAGSQSDDGQKAVAQVVLNRVRHPAFPSSVCGVVYQGSTRTTGCQFSFTCDGSLARGPSSAGWARARRAAAAALTGSVFAPVGFATHYHANYVVPYWASSLAKNAVVGAHIFYRWAGGWGRPRAFTDTYAGREPDTRVLRAAAMAAEAAEAAAPATVAEAVSEIPGAEAKTPEEGRVAIRFNLAARKAVEAAPRTQYVEKFEASDNLRWSLSEAAVDASEKPLGRPTPATGNGSGGSGGTSGSPNR